MESMKRMKELIRILNEASKAYYQEDREIMSNQEYDALYDELERLEKETGIVLADSPTQKVGYALLSSLPKVRHNQRMLSLDKTKDISKLKSFLGNQKGILSWKLDGLTIVLTYREGHLQQAVTRGNGEIGEDVTNNAKVFKNIPLQIPFKEELILRGEAVIKYSDFEKINEKLSPEEQYKNPRNLCSGSVRQLNNEVTAKRNVYFFAFSLVTAEGKDFGDSKLNQLKWLEAMGFDVVEHKLVDRGNIEEKVYEFEKNIPLNDFGSDGLVLTYDSISYSESLGTTAKFPRDSIAFKWKDEMKETKLLYIQWNTSRTGLINPVAVFESVELEGTTVNRASVHNLSILEELQLGIGDTIKVYKANMIIPQIAENLTRSNNIEIPRECPVCKGETEIRQLREGKALYCTNPNCSAQRIKALTHFVSRDAMNIEGLSEATLEKFVAKGFIKDFIDIYYLHNYEEEIKNMEGFGEKSYNNLIHSIEKSKDVELPNFIYALGLNHVGLSNAKLLCKHYQYDLDRILQCTMEDLMEIEGFGGVIAHSIFSYFSQEENKERVKKLQSVLRIKEKQKDDNVQVLAGKTFVITGSVEHFKNRKELKEKIESLGGKVTGTVTGNTDYLINNDIHSNSSKNKKAKELGIPIITEEEFLKFLP
ncbi:MAG: ligase [Epulopiscium sp.]|uniref:DNA ligase n=1 Tax=Defluviitalea raffinosedens TaxID=1450156 RepID=A0A7C8LSC3_9FIRM|nr:NAD-dependent DNA ligase LigA [Defluviitalea raffinosedens]KAE9631385.1 NAD-dependent DNA ligase LigA [Defluviitalea raffinosedens]MBZ4669267.1 ligA [Defluviitaleaceae bacterium]MDK2787506.1 ligase [Candidatus Epulonipiscium sp.]HHW67079.1 NAD-dependent DNA ligase LigA [Candidatus Epulonipiscium sp.]